MFSSRAPEMPGPPLIRRHRMGLLQMSIQDATRRPTQSNILQDTALQIIICQQCNIHTMKAKWKHLVQDMAYLRRSAS